MHSTKSIVTGKSTGGEKTEQVSIHTKNTSGCRRADIRSLQSSLLIWLDNDIDDNNEDCRSTVTELRRVVNDINTFTDVDECIDFFTDIDDNNVFMIISGALCQNIVPLSHNFAQLRTIFIFCNDSTAYEQWTKKWSKIEGVSTEITSICEALKQASQQCEQNSIPMSFIATSGDGANKNLDRLDPMFMYTQIMKEILLTIKFEPQHFKEFINYCRHIFVENEGELKNVDKFEQKYLNETPIWWYTCQCFLFPMLNRALRMSNVDIIIKMVFFYK